jgi:hypothetical protein
MGLALGFCIGLAQWQWLWKRQRTCCLLSLRKLARLSVFPVWLGRAMPSAGDRTQIEPEWNIYVQLALGCEAGWQIVQSIKFSGKTLLIVSQFNVYISLCVIGYTSRN